MSGTVRGTSFFGTIPVFFHISLTEEEEEEEEEVCSLFWFGGVFFSLSANVGDPAFPAIHQKLSYKHVFLTFGQLGIFSTGLRAEVSVQGDLRSFQPRKRNSQGVGVCSPVFTLKNDRNVPPHLSKYARYISGFFSPQRPRRAGSGSASPLSGTFRPSESPPRNYFCFRGSWKEQQNL